MAQPEDELLPIPDGEASQEAEVSPVPPTESAEELRERWLRAAAEVENTRKRMSRQLEEGRRFEREAVLRAMLPVMDSLDRALAAPDAPEDGWQAGLEAIRRQMLETLAGYGLEPFNPVGERFDPHLHEAVSVVYDDSRPEGSILDVTRPGYRFREGGVLRPAMVVVVRPDR